VNMGGGQLVSLMDFVETFEKALGHTAIRKMLAMQKVDVPRTFAAPDLLVARTGYKPDTTLEFGVKAFGDWYLEVRG
ncbi:UDP-glucuronate 5-epimerase, partial [Rhizobium johnstonii]